MQCSPDALGDEAWPRDYCPARKISRINKGLQHIYRYLKYPWLCLFLARLGRRSCERSRSDCSSASGPGGFAKPTTKLRYRSSAGTCISRHACRRSNARTCLGQWARHAGNKQLTLAILVARVGAPVANNLADGTVARCKRRCQGRNEGGCAGGAGGT